MKTIKNIFSAASIILMGALLGGCNKQEASSTAKAVDVSVDFVTFAAVGAEPQTINVYADGQWIADVADDWVEISPVSGTGNTEVTIIVDDNSTGSEVNKPRECEIYFKGASSERQGRLLIQQKGDKYKGISSVSLADAAGLEDKTVAKVASAQVVALAKDGFVAKDATASIYVDGAYEGLKAGDKISFNGEKQTLYGLASIKLDEFDVASSGSVEAQPSDITAGIDTYSASAVDYIKVSGTIVDGVIQVAGASRKLTVISPLDEFKLGELNVHKLDVTGYVIGMKNSNLALVVETVKDLGADDSLQPYPVVWAIGPAGKINYTTASFSETSSIDPIQGLGQLSYVPVLGADGRPCNMGTYVLDVTNNSNPRVNGMWAGDYWLFKGYGAIKAGSRVKIIFEARGVSGKGLKYWIVEYLDGGVWKAVGNIKTTAESGIPTEYTYEMQNDDVNVHVEEEIDFNKNNENCQIRFRVVNNVTLGGTVNTERSKGAGRLTVTDETDGGRIAWPQIILEKEGDGVEREDSGSAVANIEVSTDLLTFEGNPEEPKSVSVKSDNDFTIACGAEWISLNVKEGLADEEVNLIVTCSPTTLSSLRQAEIKVMSGRSMKVINVVQSAAGQDLDPFVAIDRSSASVTSNAQDVTVKVQSNTEYTVTPDVDWITLDPPTKGMVEKTSEVLHIAANEGAERSGKVVFEIASGAQAVIVITQGAKKISVPTVIFEDDFSWLKDMIAGYNNANPETPVSNSVGTFDKTQYEAACNAVSPNPYLNEPFTTQFPAAFANAGYVDMNAAAQVINVQDCHLRFGQTKIHTSLQLTKAFSSLAEASDATVEFDWCRHVKATGELDDLTLTLVITGDGTFENGTKYSDELTTAQTCNFGDVPETEKYADMFWTHANVKILGASSNTKVNIVYTACVDKTTGYYCWDTANGWTVKAARRWHIDNIKVTSY